MEYQVRGADKDTGNDVQIVVKADSPSVAEYVARKQGILVSDVQPARAVVTPPKPQPPDGDTPKTIGKLVAARPRLTISVGVAVVTALCIFAARAWLPGGI